MSTRENIRLIARAPYKTNTDLYSVWACAYADKSELSMQNTWDLGLEHNEDLPSS